MSRRFTRFLLGGFLLIIIFLAVLLVLPLFLNPTYLKDMAFAHIQRTFGPHIRVGETSLSLLPYPHVEVSEVTVKERPDTHAFFRAKFISLDLKLLPLLQQKFSVKELLIEQPEIEIKRDRQGEWLILQGNPQEAEDSFLASLLFMEKVVVIDGRITFIDESPKDEARGVVLEDVNLSIESASSPVQSANIEASGKIRRGQGVSELSWNGWVDFGSSSVTPTDGKGADNFQDFQIDGQLFIQDLEIRQVSEFFAYDSEMTADLGLVRLESHVTLKPGQVGYEVILSDLTVDNDHGSFSGNANITGLLADDLTVFVSMRSTPISLEIVQHAIPKSLFPSSLVARSDEAKLDGTIQVIQASVTSSSRTDVGISVLGSFQLDQSSVKIHDKAPELEIEHGVMVVEPDRVRFTDFSGTYDAIPIQSANGLILFNDSGPWLDLEVLAKVQPRQVLKVFTTFSGAKIPNTYFSRLHLLEGAGNLRLHLAGLLEGGAGVSLTAGEYDVQGVTYQIPDFERQMLIHKGTVEFTQDELKFNEINVGLGDSQLRVNGAIKVGKRALIEALSIQAVLKDALLKQIVFKSFHFPSDFLRGVVNLQARVSGFWDSPTITGDLNLLDSALHVSGVIQKQPGVAASLNYSIRVKTNGDVALDQVELAILPLKVSGRGLIRFQPTFEILARVNTGPIYLGLLPNGVVVGGQVLASGILEVSMDIRGRGLDVQQWRPRGWIALT
ncbi:MAG: AsmA family protein, partial [Nitrospirales bacterium]